MANPEHIEQLLRGVPDWNAWREANPQLKPDLSGYDFRKLQPEYWTDSNGNTHATQLWSINLSHTNLQNALMSKCELDKANLSFCSLTSAVLNNAIIKGCNARGANLIGTNLKGANLSFSDFSEADFSGAHVFGVSAWGLKLEGAIQNDLLITPPTADAAITVDDIEIAHFMYLLLSSRELRRPIGSLTRRVVLILGRFTPERKATLEALRNSIREHNYVPMLFDFDGPSNLSTIETITLFARMARFVVADLSDAKSVLQELQAIVPTSPSVPVQTVIVADQQLPGMLDYFLRFPWFLEPFPYSNAAHLIEALPELIRLTDQAADRLHSSQLRGS